jgi:hypothetical protein
MVSFHCFALNIIFLCPILCKLSIFLFLSFFALPSASHLNVPFIFCPQISCHLFHPFMTIYVSSIQSIFSVSCSLPLYLSFCFIYNLFYCNGLLSFAKSWENVKMCKKIFGICFFGVQSQQQQPIDQKVYFGILFCRLNIYGNHSTCQNRH